MPWATADEHFKDKLHKKPQTWTVDEVAAYLRMNRRTVIRMANRGEIPSIKLGRLYRFDPQKVRALFEDGASE